MTRKTRKTKSLEQFIRFNRIGKCSRSDLPSSDLRFFSLGKTNLTISLFLDEVVKQKVWAKKLSVDITIQNVLNARQRVRDGAGATPNSYQPDYLDPLGRLVSLRVVKRF